MCVNAQHSIPVFPSTANKVLCTRYRLTSSRVSLMSISCAIGKHQDDTHGGSQSIIISASQGGWVMGSFYHLTQTHRRTIFSIGGNGGMQPANIVPVSIPKRGSEAIPRRPHDTLNALDSSNDMLLPSHDYSPILIQLKALHRILILFFIGWQSHGFLGAPCKISGRALASRYMNQCPHTRSHIM